MREYLEGFAYLVLMVAAVACIISIDSVVIIARSLTANDVMIAATGVILWVLVAVETLDLMLPESDEPHDWQ